MTYEYLKGIDACYYNEAIVYIEKPVKSYVYFILAHTEGFDPLVKIGLSIDPERRLIEICNDLEAGKYSIDWLQGGVESLSVLGLLEGTQPLETALHKAFKKYKAGREWFWYNNELEEMIDDLLSDYCVCNACLIADNLCTVVDN
jgi:hypothetical protein